MSFSTTEVPATFLELRRPFKPRSVSDTCLDTTTTLRENLASFVGVRRPFKPTSVSDIRALDNNRARIRNLGAMILTVSGMLLSSSFVVLFFLIKERRDALPHGVMTILLAAVAALISAITLSLLSALLSQPAAITTKIEFIDVQTRIGLREFRRVT